MKSKSKGKGKDKGVSEVVGYILTFAIVIAAVTLIYTSGMPMIEQTSETAVLQSMKTSFISLQSNVKKVALDQSPVRTVKFNLIKGSIGAKPAENNVGNITVETNRTSPSGAPLNFGNIEYTIGSKKVIYENGAVIESTTGGNIIASDPPIYFTNYSGSHIFISVINVSGSFSAGGGIAEMHLRQSDPHNDTKVICNGSLTVNYVNISINSSYAQAWSLFLNNSYEKTFGEKAKNASFYNNTCRLRVIKDTDGVAKDLKLTLVTHNVFIS